MASEVGGKARASLSILRRDAVLPPSAGQRCGARSGSDAKAAWEYGVRLMSLCNKVKIDYRVAALQEK